jgi:hypothetical protein
LPFTPVVGTTISVEEAEGVEEPMESVPCEVNLALSTVIDPELGLVKKDI